MQKKLMPARVLLIVAALVLFAPARARAVTIEDIVALSNAGVAESVLIAVIDADQTVFTLTPQQIIDLKRAGVADSVVTRMVLTARDFDATLHAADEPPQVVIIGDHPLPPEPPLEPTFTVVSPIFGPAVPIARHRERLQDHVVRPPEDRQGDHRVEHPRGRDGQIDSFGHRAICVSAQRVDFCGH